MAATAVQGAPCVSLERLRTGADRGGVSHFCRLGKEANYKERMEMSNKKSKRTTEGRRGMSQRLNKIRKQYTTRR